MATWPATLPSYKINTFKESAPENTIRSSVGIGPDKVRRRTTSNVRSITFQMIMTAAQTATLDTFYNTTTNGGADSFTYTHPRTGATETARFVQPPSYSDVFGSAYETTISLELLP